MEGTGYCFYVTNFCISAHHLLRRTLVRSVILLSHITHP